MAASDHTLYQLNRIRDAHPGLKQVGFVALTDSCIEQLAEILRNNSTLQRLVLDKVVLSQHGFAILRSILVNTSSIHSFGLRLTSEREANPVATSFGLCLGAINSPSQNLKHLEFCHVSFDKKDCPLITRVLETSKCLETLTMTGMKGGPGDKLVCAVAQGLKKSSSLTHLALLGVTAGAKGAVALSNALAETSMLQTLRLVKCSVENSGVVALMRSLLKNSPLSRLVLRSDKTISSEGAYEIGKYLPRLQHLDELNLRFSPSNSVICTQSLLEGVLLHCHVPNLSPLSVSIGSGNAADNLINHFLGKRHRDFLSLQERPIPSSSWPLVLQKLVGDVDQSIKPTVLYYYLREYPALFCMGNRRRKRRLDASGHEARKRKKV